MSYTQTHHLFAELSEEGANDLIEAFFKARPHYLTYGSWPLVSATTVNETQVAAIAAVVGQNSIRRLAKLSARAKRMGGLCLASTKQHECRPE